MTVPSRCHHEFCAAVNTRPDLSRLRRHDAGRSARRRGDDRMSAPGRRAWQSVVGRPRVRAARARAGREGAGAGRRRRSARGRSASSGLPAPPSPTTSRSSAPRASTPIAAGTSFPRKHRAQGGARSAEAAGARRLRSHVAEARRPTASCGRSRCARRCAPTRSSSRSCT